MLRTGRRQGKGERFKRRWRKIKAWIRIMLWSSTVGELSTTGTAGQLFVQWLLINFHILWWVTALIWVSPGEDAKAEMKVHQLIEGTPVGDGKWEDHQKRVCYLARYHCERLEFSPSEEALASYGKHFLKVLLPEGQESWDTYAPTCFSHGLRTLPGDIHFTILYLSPKHHSGFRQ